MFLQAYRDPGCDLPLIYYLKYRNIGFDTSDHEMQVTGFRSRSMKKLEHDIDPYLAAVILGLEQTEYDPDEFNGLVYLSNQFDTVVLIFSGGRLTPIEFPDIATARSALEQIENTLQVLDEVS